jgi:RNA polymerase sigma-70 factor (ECF subfamily)
MQHSNAVAHLSEAPVGRAPETPLSFEAVYRAHAKTVARWALRLLGPDGDFEDVVHDAFLVVERRLPEFRNQARITTWLYAITVRVVQERRMRGRWWSWITGRGPSPSHGQGPGCGLPPAEPLTSDPHALIESRERARLLYRLLEDVREPYRTTFILFELEGLSGDEIAAVMRTNPGAVWVRLSRARRQFLERFRLWEAKEEP